DRAGDEAGRAVPDYLLPAQPGNGREHPGRAVCVPAPAPIRSAAAAGRRRPAVWGLPDRIAGRGRAGGRLRGAVDAGPVRGVRADGRSGPPGAVVGPPRADVPGHRHGDQDRAGVAAAAGGPAAADGRAAGVGVADAAGGPPDTGHMSSSIGLPNGSTLIGRPVPLRYWAVVSTPRCW